MWYMFLCFKMEDIPWYTPIFHDMMFSMISWGGTHQFMNRFDDPKSHRDFSGSKMVNTWAISDHQTWLKIQAISSGRSPCNKWIFQPESNTKVYPKHRLVYSWSGCGSPFSVSIFDKYPRVKWSSFNWTEFWSIFISRTRTQISSNL